MRYKIEDILVLSSEPFDRNYDLEASQRKFDEYVATLNAKYQEDLEKAVEAERAKWIKAVGEKIDKPTRDLIGLAFNEGVQWAREIQQRAMAEMLASTKTDKQKDV